jgi:preprotein translocase subunit YajC
MRGHFSGNFMDYLIQNAWAQGAGAAEPGLVGFLPLVILFVVFYMFLIRPQMKRQKEHAKLVQGLAKGDEAVTTGGLLGRVTDVGENFVKLEIAKDTEVKIQKHAIAQVMPKGTVKEM